MKPSFLNILLPYLSYIFYFFGDFLHINKEDKLKTGTTTVAAIGKDCIILAADMQATMGNMSYDQEAQKLYKITEYTALTNAGVVGDSLTIIRFLKSHASMYEIERETEMSPKAMASLLSTVLNSSRFYPYIVQFLLAGYLDKPELYEITPEGGVLERKQYAVSGSGTMFAMSVFDQGYKSNLAEKELVELAIKAVLSSKKRDIYTGGKSISVMILRKKKIEELSEDDVTKIINQIKSN